MAPTSRRELEAGASVGKRDLKVQEIDTLGAVTGVQLLRRPAFAGTFERGQYRLTSQALGFWSLDGGSR
jgi:hypothetical protein